MKIDIIYVRAPRFGDNENSLRTDTVRPLSLDPGAEMRSMALHPFQLRDGRILFTSWKNQGTGL